MTFPRTVPDPSLVKDYFYVPQVNKRYDQVADFKHPDVHSVIRLAILITALDMIKESIAKRASIIQDRDNPPIFSSQEENLDKTIKELVEDISQGHTDWPQKFAKAIKEWSSDHKPAELKEMLLDPILDGLPHRPIHVPSNFVTVLSEELPDSFPRGRLVEIQKILAERGTPDSLQPNNENALILAKLPMNTDAEISRLSKYNFIARLQKDPYTTCVDRYEDEAIIELLGLISTLETNIPLSEGSAIIATSQSYHKMELWLSNRDIPRAIYMPQPQVQSQRRKEMWNKAQKAFSGKSDCPRKSASERDVTAFLDSITPVKTHTSVLKTTLIKCMRSDEFNLAAKYASEYAADYISEGLSVLKADMMFSLRKPLRNWGPHGSSPKIKYGVCQECEQRYFALTEFLQLAVKAHKYIWSY